MTAAYLPYSVKNATQPTPPLCMQSCAKMRLRQRIVMLLCWELGDEMNMESLRMMDQDLDLPVS